METTRAGITARLKNETKTQFWLNKLSYKNKHRDNITVVHHLRYTVKSMCAKYPKAFGCHSALAVILTVSLVFKKKNLSLSSRCSEHPPLPHILLLLPLASGGPRSGLPLTLERVSLSLRRRRPPLVFT